MLANLNLNTRIMLVIVEATMNPLAFLNQTHNLILSHLQQHLRQGLMIILNIRIMMLFIHRVISIGKSQLLGFPQKEMTLLKKRQRNIELNRWNMPSLCMFMVGKLWIHLKEVKTIYLDQAQVSL